MNSQTKKRQHFRKQKSAGMPGPDSDIIARIRKLPDTAPPEELTAAVMGKISSKKVSWWRRIRFTLHHPISITIVPVKWAPMAVGIALMLVAWQMIPQSAQHQWNPHFQEAEYSYITGRRYLKDNLPDQALPYLQDAVTNAPENANYHFWLGVAYWATQDTRMEQQSYQNALKLNPEYLPAHVYLGHNYLDQGGWKKALDHYEKVLETIPEHSEALFNAALACRKLGLPGKENTRWTQYLNVDNTGPKALQAFHYLMGNGDFSYQSIFLGTQRLIIRSPKPKDRDTGIDPESHASLQAIGTFLQHHNDFNLHVISYQMNDGLRAKARAKAVKTYFLTRFPKIEQNRIKLSWFDVAETLEYKDKTFHVDSAIRLFAEPLGTKNNV